MATTKKTAAAKAAKEVKETKTAAPAAKETETATTTTKKAPAAKKTAIKVSLNIQYAGGNYSDKDIVEAIKAAYKAEGNEEPIKTLEIYVQPENGVAYYVINGVGGDKKVIL